MDTKNNSILPKSRLDRWFHYLDEGLWQVDFSRLSWPRRAGFRTLQMIWWLRQAFWENNLMLRAGSLTYSTLLSIVPTLALAFAVLKGLGAHYALEPLILNHVTAGSQEIVSHMVAYISRVNVGSLGTIGLLATLLTVVMLLGNIEGAFNQIWEIRFSRPLKNQISDYSLLVVLMPIFLFAALSVTASLKSKVLIHFIKQNLALGTLLVFSLRLAPFVILWCFFIFFFIFMPNTKVRWKPAVIAGIVTGTFWQTAEWAYITLQVGFSRYNAIYGTFAQLPIMMVWLFASWVIVLSGAELCFGLQNLDAIRQERALGFPGPWLRLDIAWHLLRDLQRNFLEGRPALSAEQLAQKQQRPLAWIRRVLQELARQEMVAVPVSQGRTVYLPARDFSRLEVSDLIDRLEQAEFDRMPDAIHGASRMRMRTLLEKAALARRQALKGEYVWQEEENRE
jgi:membrane protein